MLLDFATKYAEVPFEQEPLCHLDLLIFVQLACFDFPARCINLPLPQALEHTRLATFEADSAPPICALHNKEDNDLARIVSTATRYRGVFVRAFESEHITGGSHECKQFAALALECDDAAIVIFRGTDATFLGWRETFNMAVATPIPSQKHAALFLERIANRLPSKPIVLCGHSKGGNLATYAAATCTDDIAACIAAIVSFDGPALPESVMRAAGYSRIRDRITRYVPRASIVGLLFAQPDQAEQPCFIASAKPSVMQHYPYFWKTHSAQLAPSTQSPEAHVIANGVQGLIDNLTTNQKQQLVAIIFGILEASGARTFYELDGNRLQVAAAAAHIFAKGGRETRRLIAIIGKTFMKSMLP